MTLSYGMESRSEPQERRRNKEDKNVPNNDFFEFTLLKIKDRHCFLGTVAFLQNPEKLSSKRKKQKMREPE